MVVQRVEVRRVRRPFIFTNEFTAVGSNPVFADDSQLHMSGKPQNTADATDRLLCCMEASGQWMASNRLKLNPMKTDLLWCATR